MSILGEGENAVALQVQSYVEQVNKNIVELAKRDVSLGAELADVSTRLKGVKDAVDMLSGEGGSSLTDVVTDVNNLKDNVADLNTSVGSLETTVDDLSESLDTLTNDVRLLDRETDGRVTVVEKDVADLKAQETVKDVTYAEKVITVSYNDEAKEDLEINLETELADKLLTEEDRTALDKVQEALEGAGLTATYDTELGDLAMPNAVGGFTKGTTAEKLKGKTLTQMFDDLLFPTVTPTLSNPSLSLSLKSTYKNIQIVGATAPTEANFTFTFNPGAITLNSVKQNNRAGAEDTGSREVKYSGTANNTTSDVAYPSTVAEGNTYFYGVTNYAEGAQPKDNKGNNYSTPLAAGSVKSGTVKLNGTYPWFATTVSADELTQQDLIEWGAAMSTSEDGVEFTAHVQNTAPQKFSLPRKMTSLQQYSTASEKFATVSMADWSMVEEEKVLSTGVTHTYYTYTYTGEDRASVKLIIGF